MDDNSKNIFLVVIDNIVEHKEPNTWIAVLAGTLYVWYKSGAMTRLGRAIEAGISSLMAIALGPQLTAKSNYPPEIIHFAIAVVGFAFLDVITSVFSDKAAFKDIILEKIRQLVGIKK